MVFWDGHIRDNSIEAHKQGYISAIDELIDHKNVFVYLWNDDAMLDVMKELDNYADVSHYSRDINSMMLKRIAEQQGLLKKENYHHEIDILFDYIESFDYEALFV